AAASGVSLFRLCRLLGDIHLGDGLGLPNKTVPVLVNILGRSALVGDGVGDLGRLDHIDRVPRAPAFTERAADAAIQVNVAERLQARHVFAGDLVDAVHRADLDASLAAGAVI